MSFNKKVDNLLNRIENENYSFNDEDYFLIRKSKEVQLALINKIKHNHIEITNYDEIGFFEMLSNFDDNFFLSSDFQKIIINIFYMQTFYGKILEVDVIEEIAEAYNLDEEAYNSLMDIAISAIKDPSYTPINISKDEMTLNLLLDYKRYDLLEDMRILPSNISNSFMERLYKEYPFDKYNVPIFFGNYYIEHTPIEEWPLSVLIGKYYSAMFSDGRNTKEQEQARILKAITNNIHHLNDLSFLNDDFRLSEIINNIDPEIGEMLAEEVFEKNYLINVDNSIHTLEEINNKIVNIIKENKKMDVRIITEDDLENRLKNPIIRKYIIKNNLLNEIIVNYPELLLPYEDELIKEVNNNPLYKKDYSSIDSSNLLKLPRFLNTLIDNNIVKDFHIITIREETVPLVKLLLTRHPEIRIHNYEGLPNKMDIMINELNHKHFNDLVFGSILSRLSVAEFYQLYPHIKDMLKDYYFADCFIKNQGYIFSNFPELYDLYFEDEFLTELALERIAHDETLTYMYNPETYIKIKQYLVNKYQLDPKKLDYLVSKTSPIVIRYIDNQNIQDILKLSSEELVKILNLFPKVEYTLDDINASYDSLVQYMFGRYNQETISIFPNLLHAIEDENHSLIKKYRDILVMNTSRETLDTIIKKYKLNNIKNTGVLLDLIIANINSSEGEKYKNILHELTDNYILNERTRYRNNRYFDRLYPGIVTTFSSYYEHVGEERIPDINRIAKSLDKKFFTEITRRINLPDDLKDGIPFVLYLEKRLADPKTRDDYLPILKETIDYYYNKCRQEHLNEINIYNELKIPYGFEPKNKNRVLTDYVIENINSFKLKTEPMVPLLEYIINELKEYNLTEEIIQDCCNYVLNRREFLNTDIETIKEYIPIVINAINKIITTKKELIVTFYNNQSLYDIEGELDKRYLFKRLFYIPKRDNNTVQILMNINIELVKNNLLNDEELYNKLLTIMHKKKLHYLPDNLKILIEDCNISSDYNNIAGFISFFRTILNNERSRLASNNKNPDDALSGLTSILIQAEIYSSISNVYPQILGQEDANLIKANPKPNDAYRKTENNQRLKEAIDLTIELFKRRTVTIPTFDKEFQTGNKRLNVIVGNFTAPCNLTHGERTGACMRIGGVGESLFDFCLRNSNGFHIRFEDPITHEYISRVSGFRNGNTVFLNELRHSCSPLNYTDEDIVNVCRQTAEELIKLSANSTCPIENVVIANEYAMIGVDERTTDLNVRSIKTGLPKFYSDVDNNAVVLATTTPPFKAIDFDKTNVPEYETCRGKIIATKNKKVLSGKINRIASINAILNGTNYMDIDNIQFEDGLIYGIVSDDWYIYVNSQKEIKYDYIKEDPRALKELSYNLKIVASMLKNDEIEEDIAYGL